jgi:hypothetical protein
MYEDTMTHTEYRRIRTIRIMFFLAGLSNFFRLQVNVQVIPIEIIAVVISLFSLVLSKSQDLTTNDNKLLRFLNSFCAITVLNQVIVDRFQNVFFPETLKSIAQAIVLWGLLRVAIIYIKPDILRFISYSAGYFLSILVQYIIDPTPYMQIDPWKFAFGPAITGLVFLLYKSNKFLVGKSLLLIFLVLVGTYLGSRSLALFTVLALIITIRKVSIRKTTLAGGIGIGLVFLTLLFGFERLYFQLSTSGTLGLSQQLKALDQYRAGPILIAGRSEVTFQISAIAQNPILGNGSNPELTTQMLIDAQKINSSLGVKTENTNAYKATLLNGRVPQHSMLFSAWVEGGVVSVAFWVIIFVWAVRKLVAVPNNHSLLGDFTTFVGLSTLWAIVFSPLGAGSRMDLAIGLVALLLHSKNGHNAH